MNEHIRCIGRKHMNRTLTLLVASAVLAAGSIARVSAGLIISQPIPCQPSAIVCAKPVPSNQAILNVLAIVYDTCVVTQPKLLVMAYDPVLNTGLAGQSQFTWACTNGDNVSVTPTSNNLGPPSSSDWVATNGGSPSGPSGSSLNYLLYNDQNCVYNQLTNGTSELLGASTGQWETYYICGTPDTSQQQNVPIGRYIDQVTFTFNASP
jgi:Spore Coat Protein U domain